MRTVANIGPLVFPCPIVVDTRERLDFTFANIQADARDGRRPIAVETIPGTLRSGDYSLLGFEDRVAIERKNINDLFSTIGQGRRRFQRELERLSAPSYEFAAVVCEADWAAIVANPPERSMLSPKIVFRSVVAWQLRYPRIHWWMCPGRAFAEKVTFRLLERFLKERGRAANRRVQEDCA